jgi:hypothetical protein
MKSIWLMLAVVALGGAALAQTSSATVSIAVTAAPVPAAVTVTSSATTVPAGSSVAFGVGVSGASGAATPTGKVELLATLPGATTKTLVNTFTLSGGSMTCSYALPATAPVGTYQLEFAYGGDANYKAAADFQ